jgi:hypothetical protein
LVSFPENLLMDRVRRVIGTRIGVRMAALAVRSVTVFLCGPASSFGAAWAAAGAFLVLGISFLPAPAAPIQNGDRFKALPTVTSS